MKKILFLCTGNSCRSQMAEGLFRKIGGSEFEVYSAGTKKHVLNERAVQVMKEIGIDISNHYSKTVSELPSVTFDYVVTVCDSARETCPYYPGGKMVHKSFDDPPTLTKDKKNEEEILAVYRKVRDEISQYVKELKENLA